MNIFRHMLLVLFSISVMQQSLIADILVSNIETEILLPCIGAQQGFAYIGVSAFVEEVGYEKGMLFITEPTRKEIHTELQKEQLQELEGMWINVYFYREHPICFELDHNKTEKMKRKSEHLLKSLQEKSSQPGL